MHMIVYNNITSGTVPSVTSEPHCDNFTTPTLSEDKNNTYNSDILYTISWDAPCEVDSYTFYYTNQRLSDCHNTTFNANMTSHTVENVNIVQIGAHRNERTVKCSLSKLFCNNPLIL